MASADNAIPPGESPEPYLEEAHDPRRRDFINVAAVAFAGVGAGVVVLPLVNQMSPSADVLALSTTEVDLSKIAAVQAVPTARQRAVSGTSVTVRRECAGRRIIKKKSNYFLGQHLT